MSCPETERERSHRERHHFEEVLAHGDELYWADRTPAGRRRQEIRADRLRSAASADAPEAKILDVGCGTGAYTKPFARCTKATVVAFDVTCALLRNAQEGSTPNVHYVAANASQLPFPPESFDAVVGNAVLHHLPLGHAVPELLRVLKRGGRFCFAEPNLLNPHVFLERNVP